MKIIAPPAADFSSYIARPETIFIEREDEPLATLYSQGFLPYSSTENLHNVFYSARSARIALPELALTSENRRIARKFDGQFSKERAPLPGFNADEAFYSFCLDYFAAKHGADAMPRARLKTILSAGLITAVATYRNAEDAVVAYVLEVAEGAMAHYWFSFYDLVLAKQSLGLWLMLDCARDAQARGLAHYYLGTVYGHKALYKTNFEPLEWWSGSAWSRDIVLLKDLSRSE
jgi:arginyl-tRNA--protein-N-Asp/Glu arginylyltransferase